VLEGNPDIDTLLVQPERARAATLLRLALRILRRYDLAITAQYNDRPYLWALIASAHRAGVVPPKGLPGSHWKRWLTSRWCEFRLGEVHAVEQVLRVADALGIERAPEVVPPRIRAPHRGDASGASTPRDIAPSVVADGDTTAYAVVHPVPQFRYKAWPVEGWRALVHHLVGRGLAVKLTGGPADAERALLREIVDGLDAADREHVAELGGRLPFAALTPLIEGARIFVGPDTSVTHLAAATGTPTIALFGPSHPVAWGPWPLRWRGEGPSPWQLKAPLQRRGNVWLIQGEGDCVPCNQEGCDRHLESHSRCLDELSVERVIAVVDEVLVQRRVNERVASPTAT